MLSSPDRVRRGPRHRISAVDFSTAEELLRTAAAVVVPDDQQQRQAFEKLMPSLYVLRNKGCSFEQLTKFLNEAGFNLQTSTVRIYYYELLSDRMDICQVRMNEQIALMARIQSQIADSERKDVSGRIKSLIDAERHRATRRVDVLWVGPDVEQAYDCAPPAPAVASKPIQDRKSNSNPSAQAPNKSAHSPPMRPTETSQQLKLRAPTETVAREEPSPTSAQVPLSATDASGQSQVPVKVQPLKPNVPRLKPRENVAPEVYQPGALEHPAIRGLMLTLDERLYGASLEYVSTETGEVFSETADQKRFRITWRRPVPMTKTRTAGSFVEMDNNLFSGR